MHYTFDDMEALLRRVGFSVRDDSCGKYRTLALSRGDGDNCNSLCGMLTGNEQDCTAWRLAIDNDQCYDKPSKCPIYFTTDRYANMPTGEFERRLKSACDRLATQRGYEESNESKYERFQLENQPDTGA